MSIPAIASVGFAAGEALAAPMSMPAMPSAVLPGLPPIAMPPMLPISLISSTWRGRGAGAATVMPSRGASAASTDALRSSVSTHSG